MIVSRQDGCFSCSFETEVPVEVPPPDQVHTFREGEGDSYLHRDMARKRDAFYEPQNRWLRKAINSWVEKNQDSPIESWEEQQKWQAKRAEILLKPSNFWLSEAQLFATGQNWPPPNGYSGYHSAGEALRNAIKDGLWRCGPQVHLLVSEFILPPWFDRFMACETISHKPVWNQVTQGACIVCGKITAAIHMFGDSPGEVLVKQESFYTGEPLEGASCSERCSAWADWYRLWDDQVPFWALQYAMTEVDRYAIVSAMASQFGTKAIVHLQMGYNFVMSQKLAESIPFFEIVEGENHDLKNFLRAGRNFPS